MAKKTLPKRPVTVEDLESLVRALAPLIRASVREEVQDAIGPLRKAIATISLSRLTPDQRFNIVHDALDVGAIDVDEAKKLLETP